jgi:hypothetical protein
MPPQRAAGSQPWVIIPESLVVDPAAIVIRRSPRLSLALEHEDQDHRRQRPEESRGGDEE